MTPTANRIVIPLLGASVAINIFLAGMMIGQGRSVLPPPRHDHSGMQPAPQSMLADMEKSLSSQDAAIFHKIMVGALPSPDEPEQDVAAVQKAMTASPFDAQVFHQALQRIHERHAEMDGRFVQSLTEAVSQISPDGRAKLAVTLGRMHPPGSNTHGDFNPAHANPGESN
jgi:uncharacterized membrane protein